MNFCLLPAQTLQSNFFLTSTSIDHSSFSLVFQSGVQTRLFAFVLKTRPQPILLCFIKFELTGKHPLQSIIRLVYWRFGLVVWLVYLRSYWNLISNPFFFDSSSLISQVNIHFNRSFVYSLVFRSGVLTHLFAFVLKSRLQPILFCFIKFDLTGMSHPWLFFG